MGDNSGPGYATYPAHRVTVEPAAGRVVVTFDGEVIADTTDALLLRESMLQPVYYLPRRDVKMERLVRSAPHTYCPFKGEASYFSSAAGRRAENAAWTYEAPYDEVLAIKDRLAFYSHQVSITAAVE